MPSLTRRAALTAAGASALAAAPAIAAPHPDADLVARAHAALKLWQDTERLFDLAGQAEERGDDPAMESLDEARNHVGDHYDEAIAAMAAIPAAGLRGLAAKIVFLGVIPCWGECSAERLLLDSAGQDAARLLGLRAA